MFLPRILAGVQDHPERHGRGLLEDWIPVGPPKCTPARTMSLTTTKPDMFTSTQTLTPFPAPTFPLTTFIPVLTSSAEPRTEPENVTFRTTFRSVTSSANETGLNSTQLPVVSVEGAGVGMVLVPFGIITVIGLAVVVVSELDDNIKLLKFCHLLKTPQIRLLKTDSADI